jgi:hypothetical protein
MCDSVCLDRVYTHRRKLELGYAKLLSSKRLDISSMCGKDLGDRV